MSDDIDWKAEWEAAARHNLRISVGMNSAILRAKEGAERIADMLKSDDGQAWKEARKFLQKHYPEMLGGGHE